MKCVKKISKIKQHLIPFHLISFVDSKVVAQEDKQAGNHVPKLISELL